MPNPMRIKAIQGLKEGDQFNYKRTFTQTETVNFGDMIHDYNPVHYDMGWASLKGFEALICHGMLVSSMICEFGGQVGWLATGMQFQFIKPVYSGDTVDCRVKITKIQNGGRAEASAEFYNQDEQLVITAQLKGRLPMDHERKYLQKMVTTGDATNKLSGKQY